MEDNDLHDLHNIHFYLSLTIINMKGLLVKMRERLKWVDGRVSTIATQEIWRIEARVQDIINSINEWDVEEELLIFDEDLAERESFGRRRRKYERLAAEQAAAEQAAAERAIEQTNF